MYLVDLLYVILSNVIQMYFDVNYFALFMYDLELHRLKLLYFLLFMLLELLA